MLRAARILALMIALLAGQWFLVACGGGTGEGSGGGTGGSAIPIVAADDSATLSYSYPWYIPVIDNDAGDGITIVRWTNPGLGSIRLESDRGFTFTPDPMTFGPDSFTYTIRDRSGEEATAVVSVMIQRPNLPPVVQGEFYVTTEDGVLDVPAPGVLANDTEPEGESWVLTLPINSKHGMVVLRGDGGFTYTPKLDFTGMDSFTYRLRDARGAMSEGRVDIQVDSTPDAPRVTNDDFVTAPGSTLFITAPGVLLNDVEPDGEVLIATLLTNTKNGSVSLGQGGAMQYVPNLGFIGKDTFTYRATDPTGRHADGLVVIDVGIFNIAPNAVNDTYTTVEDTALVVVSATGLLANDNDFDSDPLYASLNSPPGQGSVTVDVDGAFTYVPYLNAFGTDRFSYIVSDGRGGLTSAWVDIVVTPVNDAPLCMDDVYSTPEGVLLVVPTPGVLGNDFDPEGTPLSVVQVLSTSFGSATIGTNGNLQFLPPAAFNGVSHIVFEVMDQDGLVETSTATIHVTTMIPPPGGLPAGALIETGNLRNDFRIEISRSGQPSVLQGSSVTVSIGIQDTASQLPTLNRVTNVKCVNVLTGATVPLSSPTVVNATIMGYTFDVSTINVGFGVQRYRITATNVLDEVIERELAIPVHTGNVLLVGPLFQYQTVSSALIAAANGDAIHIAATLLSGLGNVGLVVDKDVVIAGEGCVIDAQNTNASWLMANAAPIVSGLTFVHSTESAIHSLDCPGVLFNCAFIDNTSSVGGGALSVQGGMGTTHLPKILNCLFQQNISPNGGAINIEHAKRAEVVQSTFYSNRATSSYSSRGGAIAVANGEGLVIRNSSFIANDVLMTSGSGNGGYIPNGAGGAVAIGACSYGSQPALHVFRTELKNNKVGTVPASIEIVGYNPDLAGGALSVEATPSYALNLDECVLHQNNVRSYPSNTLPSLTGTGYAIGGAVFLGRPSSKVIMTSSRFTGNHTFSPSMSVGGAVCTQPMPLGLVQHTVFLENEARGPGTRNVGGAWGCALAGAIPFIASNAQAPFDRFTMANVLVAQNRALTASGLSFGNTDLSGPTVQPFGFNTQPTPTQIPVIYLRNLTLAHNTPVSGTLITPAMVTALPVVMRNSILWNPQHIDVSLVDGASAPPTFSGVPSSGSLDIASSIAHSLSGVGSVPNTVIDADPLFTPGVLGNYYLTQPPQQQSTSPAVNTGDESAIQAGLESRTTKTNGSDDSGIVDMGYHYLY